jgi:hypothetical protein
MRYAFSKQPLSERASEKPTGALIRAAGRANNGACDDANVPTDIALPTTSDD